MFRSISQPPLPPKLVRSTNKDSINKNKCVPIPRVHRPLVWSTPEKPEYMSIFAKSPTSPEPLTAPLVPKGILPDSSYPVHAHVALRELCQDLQYAFSEVELLWSRQENQFRWDVRTTDEDKTKMETGIDVRVFSEEERLCVHFQVHYGENWYAHELIDQISMKLPVNMSESIHPWKKGFDEQLGGGYLS
uniref:Uncharacterized protein n=1 Tax=viral metagenome TaxID=1070528 RepID=A0A6C0B8F9_9ZZZZ